MIYKLFNNISRVSKKVFPLNFYNSSMKKSLFKFNLPSFNHQTSKDDANLTKKLMQKLGSIDGEMMIRKLSLFNIIDFKIINEGISIPISQVKDISALRNSLHNSSRVGLEYQVNINCAFH